MSNKINVTSLASSSKGNCYHIKSGSDEILIDAGISAKCICDGLSSIGTCIDNIKAIFVTHEHIDHVKGLFVLTKKRDIPIHMMRATAEEFLRKHPECERIIAHDDYFVCRLGNMKIGSFFSSHDSADCVGYTVETDEDKFGLATDTGYIDRAAVNALLKCNSVVLESNYDEKMLINGSYPEDLKIRIKSSTGHLSNYDCAAFARFLAENGTKNFMLGHLSEENNTPEIALNITTRALANFEDVVVKVASVNTPTELI